MAAATRPGREAGFRPDGGCGFPADPALDAREAGYFWRPEIAPTAVVALERAHNGNAPGLQLSSLAVEVRSAEEGVYLLLRSGLQVLLSPGADITGPLAAILPLDADLPARLAAAEALHRLLTSATPPADPLSFQRRRRLKRMLRALDGRAAGATYREVAGHVLDEAFTDSSAWRTSAVRDVAIRLCRGAVRLVRGSYLALLRKKS